jgi:arylsulfatase A-like enzyme
MNCRDFLKFAGMNITSTFLLGCHRGDSLRDPSCLEVGERPNFIIILCDNLGYGDLGCFGSTVHRTTYVDQMAKEGMLLTCFYASSGVCTPSRASLMTGCYAQRVDMHISDKNERVLRPVSAKGLNPNEVTLPEILQKQGYATACIGKWHLGDQPEFLPRNHGFDYFSGIPYSEDMTPAHTSAWPPLPLIRNEEVVEAPVDLTTTTRRYIKEAMWFIRENRARPFFLYFANHLPGSKQIPEVDPQFLGRSINGRYGDSIEEIDFSVGQIIDALRKLALDKRTLMIFTSDNGTPQGHGGSNAPLSGWGYSTMEGGMRVPCIVRWPGMVPAGTTCDELCTTMDLLPTFARLAGTESPKDRIIDGKNIWHLLAGEPGAESPYDVFYYYMADQLQAIRSGKWKLHLPIKRFSGKRASRPMKLVDLSRDIGETTDLSQQHPEVVKKLLALAEKARGELGDSCFHRNDVTPAKAGVGRKGSSQRKAGFVPHPTPRQLKM